MEAVLCNLAHARRLLGSPLRRSSSGQAERLAWSSGLGPVDSAAGRERELQSQSRCERGPLVLSVSGMARRCSDVFARDRERLQPVLRSIGRIGGLGSERSLANPVADAAGGLVVVAAGVARVSRLAFLCQTACAGGCRREPAKTRPGTTASDPTGRSGSRNGAAAKSRGLTRVDVLP